MWDVVGNPEDRFSHNEAYIEYINKAVKDKGADQAARTICAFFSHMQKAGFLKMQIIYNPSL